MNQDKLEQLFKKYETAFAKLEFEKIAELYTDTFISAGPKGTIAQNKNDFLGKAKQASEFYKSIGQNSAKILSKKESQISGEYTMITVHWGLTFEKTGDQVIQFDVSYIVQETGKEPKIIMFIAHQDEEEAMKKLGLQPQRQN
jgi:hypothetical protein